MAAATVVVACLTAGCGSDGKHAPTVTGAGGTAGSGGAGADASGGRSSRPDAGTAGSGSGGRDVIPPVDRDGGLPHDGGPPPRTLPDGAPLPTFTVSGKLNVSDLMFVDTDTGNPSRVAKSNDTPELAQGLVSPALVGGYLGNTTISRDIGDLYRLALYGNETITLYIATPSQGPVPDFDLGLYDSAGKRVATSEGNGQVEMVTPPGPGTYFVAVVTPDTGEGIYTLSIASAVNPAVVERAAASRLSTEFPLVPGEALVKLKAGNDASAFAPLGVAPLGSGANAVGYYRVSLSPKTTALARTKAPLTVEETLAAIKRLRASPDVTFAEPNYVRTKFSAPPNDPLFSAQWNYESINLLDAWDHTRGAGTIVAVVDTGVKYVHPDFKNTDTSSQLLPGYDMISSRSRAADGDGRDSNADDPGDFALSPESSWHGSHVSGTIAAATNNGVGCAGIAPEAKILPVRVLGIDGGTTDDIVQGILYAAGLENDAAALPAKAADVINMSLGGPGRSQATAAAVKLARDAGVVVVAAAGNDSVDATFYSPAGEPGVVTVSAVGPQNGLAPYSNYGNVIDVAGPGGDETLDVNADGIPDGVISLVYASGGKTLYSPYEGTSMAAPHVSGIVALMKAVYPGLTPDGVDDIIAGNAGLASGTQDLGVPGKDADFGYGLLNANLGVLSALEAGSKPQPDTPILKLSATTIDFGALDVTRPLELSNVGRGTLDVNSVAADAPWVTVSPGTVGSNTVTVDRAGLSSGVHSSTLTVQSSGGTKTVTVRLTAGNATPLHPSDVGTVYVLLVDPATSQVVTSTTTSIQKQYAFTLDGVRAGQYLLYAGSDMDNNGAVDDDGEAFGIFPVLSDPSFLSVSGDVPDVSFAVRYQFQVGASGSSAAHARAHVPKTN